MPIRATYRDYVLDVGSGSHPHSTADVLVELFFEDTIGHRSNTPVVKDDRPLVQGDVQDLPFGDKSFDYVICNHVVEHVDNPVKALREISRVGKRGWLGLPTEFYEFICPSPTHQWVFALRNGKLLFKRKQERHDSGVSMYGGLFFILYQFPEFQNLVSRRSGLFGIDLEWTDEIVFEQVDDDFPFFDYSDPDSVKTILAITESKELSSRVKSWLRSQISEQQFASLQSLKRLARRSMKRKFVDTFRKSDGITPPDLL